MTQEELKISINIGAETAEEAIEALQRKMTELQSGVGKLDETVKSAAEGAVGALAENTQELGESVSKLGKEMQGTAQKATKELKDGVNGLGTEMDGVKAKTQETTAETLAFAAAAAAAFGTIVSAIGKGTSALSAYQGAMKGLESVASGRGIGTAQMQDALDGVTDAFFSATAAATAYKNLLTRGYSLEQATNTILRLKDAAAFGRQANMSLEDAVTSATEGIRNENSVLVDNAGVTKNVAKMWEDYAKARGLVTANLTQAQKVEAEYLGIMEETQLQAGDLAKASDTLAGSQAAQAAQVTKLATAYGSAMAPAVQTVTEAATALLSAATGFVEAAPGISSGLTVTAAGFTGLMAVLKAVKAAQQAFNIAALANPYVIGAAAIAAAIGIVVGALTHMANAEERAAEKRKESKAQIQTIAKEQSEINKLSQRYKELTSQENLTKEQTEELAGIVETLNTKYEVNIDLQGDVKSAYEQGNKAIGQRIDALNAEAKALAQIELHYAQQEHAELQRKQQSLMGAGIESIIAGPEYVDVSGQMLAHVFTDIEDQVEKFEGIAPELAERMRESASVVFDAISGSDEPMGTDTLNAMFATMYEQWSAFAQAYSDQLGESLSQSEEYINALDALISGNTDAWNDYIDTVSESGTETEAAIEGIAAATEATQSSLSETGELITGIAKNLEDTRDALDWKREIAQDRRELKKAVDAMNDGVDVGEEWGKAIKDALAQYGAADTIDLSGTLGAEIESVENETQALENRINDTIATARTLIEQIRAGAYGELTLDDEAAMAVLEQLIATMEAHGLEFTGASTGKKGGGGGGKSKAEQKAEEARRAQEEAYNLQIQLLEHRRRMDQLTLKEEIDNLERIRRTYASTAEQIRDIDERIYAARKALLEQEQEQIGEYHDAIVDALEARYQAQRDAEQKRIDESIKAWETWSDETCAAIQAQIDALDDKAEAEDREAAAAEKQRAIDRIRQAMAYETDEYDMRQLQKQLEQAEKAWADLQKQWEREDAKKALEDQMQAVQDKADAEIGALEKEAEEIDAWYEEMTDAQRLSQEAQEMLLQKGQEDMIALLREYAPEYRAAGEDIGAALYEGFVSRFGDITAFFDRLTDALSEPMVRATAQTAGTAASMSGTGAASAQIVQNVTFTVPVETPADTARKMRQVNEALAAMI